MRGWVPVEKHDSFATFYGDYSGYQKAPGMENTSLAYVFLLNPEGIICWKDAGMPALKPKKNFLTPQ